MSIGRKQLLSDLFNIPGVAGCSFGLLDTVQVFVTSLDNDLESRVFRTCSRHGLSATILATGPIEVRHKPA